MKKMINLQDGNTSVRGMFRRFRKAEDGAMIIFSLFLFVLILWFGGMAVDLMRFETTRAKLQGSLDRAVLAAADLDQTLPPADVVRDYLSKAGMLHFLQGEPTVTEGINFRVVSVQASAPMPLFFYDLPRIFSNPFTPGMSTLSVSGNSTAEERVTDVEVSLVLDVSSSMNSNSRMTNLRPAARDFVSTVLANNTNAPQGLITISMIPYSAVVNVGTTIAPLLNIDRNHNYSTCPMFDDDIFDTTALDLSAEYDHIAHFSYGGSNDTPINADYTWCFTGDTNAIIPHTTNEADLHTAINDLHAYGNTAIDMGVKWGVALLDPSTQSLITTLAGATGSSVPAIAAGRPELHTQSDVLKVLVLMTDGSNTQQWDLSEPYKSSMSPVWFDRDTASTSLLSVDFDNTSVQYSGESTASRSDDWFYWNGYPSSSRFQRYPNGFANQTAYINALPVGISGPGQGTRYVDSDGDEIYNATWQELFADRTYNRVNNTYLGRAYSHGAWSWSEYIATDYAIDQSVVNGTEANARLSEICEAARAQGIVIYTVAFEAPSGGQTALQDCASSPSHYFDVAGTDISAAFNAIASDIRALKLTQ